MICFVDRQIVNHTSAGAQSMDARVSQLIIHLLRINRFMLTLYLSKIRSYNRYHTGPPFPSHTLHLLPTLPSNPIFLSSNRMQPHIEDSYSVTRNIDGKSYFLSLTDTAGQEEYRGLWAASNLRSDAFLLVYDITNHSSLSSLDYFLQMVDMECEHRHDSGGVQPVKIVAGNKCDLKDARMVSSRQGLEWARGRDCGFMETSAREMVNIEETFARTSPVLPLP